MTIQKYNWVSKDTKLNANAGRNAVNMRQALLELGSLLQQ